VYVGSDDTKLYAFDAKTGAQLWSAATGGPVVSSPAIVDGVVYVGSDDTKLYAFDASGKVKCSGTPKTCAPLWTAVTGGPVSSPAVSNGVVYVSSYTNLDVFNPSYTNLSAFDANGKINCSGTPKTCAPLWTAKSYGTRSSPAVAHGVVYVGGAATVSLGAFGGIVIGFLSAFDASGKVNCSDTPKTCAPVWMSHATSGPSDSSPAVSNGMVYVGSKFDNNLYGYDTTRTGCRGNQDCHPNLTASTTGSIDSSPAVANGVVYVGSGDTKLYAFDATTGTRLWSAATGGPIASSPAVANGTVYVGSDDGRVYAFGLP
jgi:outer membrane protein assembly factor BamB